MPPGEKKNSPLWKASIIDRADDPQKGTHYLTLALPAPTI